MKKIVTAILLVVIAFGLVSCASPAKINPIAYGAKYLENDEDYEAYLVFNRDSTGYYDRYQEIGDKIYSQRVNFIWREDSCGGVVLLETGVQVNEDNTYDGVVNASSPCHGQFYFGDDFCYYVSHGMYGASTHVFYKEGSNLLEKVEKN